ncbi:FAD-binding oxidoreductase [Thiomicrorhabdus sp.]|uniref:FAD-binding oxidoreductase n=1 Tax=Thiomicrorhabdus sp. TaxID=2039724 RepID=UPI0029C69DFD|nr:FAD-binding oxidoreductase [Thiomicrorhabdus sp.]
MKKISGWGRFPIVDAEVVPFRDHRMVLDKLDEAMPLAIPRGNGRSYGDSALGNCVYSSLSLNRFIAFDENTGVLRCQSGVLLSAILDAFLPRGWFPGVTPGTKYVTVGGAIASDVHGKNHHLAGCFSETVVSLMLMLPSGELKRCSKTENSDLFRATCGGMGLTGMILETEIQLKAVNSKNIEQTTIKTANLAETFSAFEELADQVYSVAWIDCLADKKSIGRSLIMAGDFKSDGDLRYTAPHKHRVPFDFPSFALNRYSVKAFNTLYYARGNDQVRQEISVDSFFYPLDALSDWNRIYGKNGFVQYQFILPKEQSFEGLNEILALIAARGMASFLAVLKLYGATNANFLSFPMEGYSLALDFKVQKGLFSFLDELDALVLKYRGRIYLAKDARMSREVFEQGYPGIERFRALREEFELNQFIRSYQSERLGL